MGKSKELNQEYIFRHSTAIVQESTDVSRNTTNVKIEGWLQPKSQEKQKYHQYCSSIIKRIKQIIFDEQLKIACEASYLVDMDLRTAAVAPNKLSYYSFQIMVTSLDEKELNLDYFLILMDIIFRSCEVMSYQRFKN